MAEMVEEARPVVEATVPADDDIVFGGEPRNMAMGIAMLFAGGGAFITGLTKTFFGEAMAITFIFWGLFFVYGDLLLSTRKFIVGEDGLTIDVPMRPWSRKKVWAWKDINRVDVMTHRRDIREEMATLQVHHQFPGEISLDREDRNFNSELAQLIIERAKLKPDAATAKFDLSHLPAGQDATYTWKK